MKNVDKHIVEAWQLAAADLGFTFTPHYVLSESNGARRQFLGLVHDFGAKKGTLILPSLTSDPLPSVPDGFFASCLTDAYATYNRELFIDTLNDWQWCGTENKKPSWYTGTFWG